MDQAEQLRILQAAQGDPAKLALATVDLAYPALTEVERVRIKEALEAAAIPHWCDEVILAALLEITPEEGALRLAKLRGLGFVESFPARGVSAINVHEATRLPLRVSLARERQEWFGVLTLRAANHFATAAEPHTKIESAFHRALVEPKAGPNAIDALYLDWTHNGRFTETLALAVALDELHGFAATPPLSAAVAAQRLADILGERQPVEKNLSLADEALAIFRARGDIVRLSSVLDTQGRFLVARGDLAGALKAYEESLAVGQRLAASDASNAGWQRDVSVSLNKMGDVLRDQGDLAGALKAYEESLVVRQRLAASDASNAGWQRDVSVSQEKMGDVLRDQGDLAGALKAYQEALAVRQRLAASDASNAGWQRDVSVSLNKMGDVLQDQGDLAGALKAYREDLAISQRLAASDASNAGWQRDLSVSLNKMGDVLQDQGDLAGALKAYQEALAVSQRLAASDASNAGWQRDLSVSLNKMGDVLRAQGDLAGALKAYQEALAVRQRLAASDPGNAGWLRDIVISYWRMAEMAEKSGSGEALGWWQKAYEVLSAMKQRGIMLPTDEPFLEQLKRKAGR